MENLTINISASVREDTLRGRPCWVAPMTLIVEGVLNGSKGPLFYPASEIRDSADSWNGMPIIVNHPYKSGVPVSARRPDIMNDRQIGTVLNTQYRGGKLVAEAWVDIENCNCVDPSIAAKISARMPIELSTGLFTENVPASQGATFNGRPYSYTARNFRPDHLALLPAGEEGACSIADVCGLLANTAGGEPLPNNTLKFGSPEPMQDLSEPLTTPRIAWQGKAGQNESTDGPLTSPSIDWSK